MKIKGKITTWNADKGFGFITPDSGGRQVFIHINEFRQLQNQPSVGLTVMYSLSTDKQGRPCAKIAKFNGLKPRKKRNGKASLYFGFLFIVIVGISTYFDKLPTLVLLLYLTISFVTFIVYAVDKSKAKSGMWRTQESTLHILSLIGGWPGALFAQQTLRHKTTKQEFRLVFWLTVIINIGLFIWAQTPEGSIQLQKWMSIF